MNKLTFWSQYWWFWGLMLGVPVAGYLGYRYLQQEGYLGAPEWERYGYDEFEAEEAY